MIWWTVIAAVAGVAAVIATLVYGEIQRRMAAEQLRLAREQASRQPALEARLRFVPKNLTTGVGTLKVTVTNAGETAAQHVHGWVRFDADYLGPYKPPRRTDSGQRRKNNPLGVHIPTPVFTTPLAPQIERSWGQTSPPYDELEGGFYVVQVWEHDVLLPGTQRTFDFELQVRAEGEATVRCALVSANGAVFEGEVRFPVPPEDLETIHP